MVLEGLMTGFSLHALSKEEGLPSYGSMLRRIRDDSGFRERLDAARAARAYHLEDKMLAIAESELTDKDVVPGARLRFDIYNRGAEVGAPEKFGKKVTVAGDQSRPIIFKVLSGVPEPAPRVPGNSAAPGLSTSVSLEADTIETTARPVGSMDGLPGVSESGSALLDALAREKGVVVPDDETTKRLNEGEADGR
jgi:hypothetical protein